MKASISCGLPATWRRTKIRFQIRSPKLEALLICEHKPYRQGCQARREQAVDTRSEGCALVPGQAQGAEVPTRKPQGADFLTCLAQQP